LKTAQPCCGFEARWILSDHFPKALLKVGQTIAEIYADARISHEKDRSSKNARR
jgi:hypothetical protein